MKTIIHLNAKGSGAGIEPFYLVEHLKYFLLQSRTQWYGAFINA